MNLQSPRQFAHAGQRLPRLKLSRGDMKNDLLRQLLAERDFTLFADANVHDGLGSRVSRPSVRLPS
jgi:hypothetical protein